MIGNKRQQNNIVKKLETSQFHVNWLTRRLAKSGIFSDFQIREETLKAPIWTKKNVCKMCKIASEFKTFR